MNEARPLKVRIGMPERPDRRNAATVTRVDVYDDIGAGGWFGGGISAQDFVAQVKGIKGSLDIHVNSSGGDVFDGIAIASAIRDHKGQVTTVVDGLAASIASVIAQAGQERVMAPGSMLMIHDAFGATTGNADEMAKMAETLDQVSENIAGIYATRAGGSPEQWRSAMKDETWYTADEAVAAGLADKVGDGTAALPPGLDVAAFSAVPGRIAAQLRALPAAVAPDLQDAAQCKTCGGSGRLKHPATGKPGKVCPGCGGSGEAPAGGDEEDQGEPDDDVEGAENKALTVADVIAIARHEIRAASGQPGTHGDHERYDPDGDGDCDACPEGDTDHDFWTAGGKQLQSVPGKPMPKSDALTGEDLRAMIREEMASAAGIANAIPDTVKDQFLKDLKSDSTSDVASAIHRLAQWAGSGNYPAGCSYTDLKWFYDQCCIELKRRDPDSEAGGNFPPQKSSDAWQGGMKNCHALTVALGAIAEASGGGKEDKTEPDLSGINLGELRAALKGAVA